MALEDIKAEIAILLHDMVNQPNDTHQLAQQLQEKLNIMKVEELVDGNRN